MDYCQATGCGIKILSKTILCRNHWAALPRVYRTELVSACKEPLTKEYYRIAKMCIIHLANEDGLRPDTRIYDEVLYGKKEE